MNWDLFLQNPCWCCSAPFSLLCLVPGRQLPGLAAALGFGVSFLGAICLRVWKHGLCGGTLAGLYSGTVLKGSRWGNLFLSFYFYFFFCTTRIIPWLCVR